MARFRTDLPQLSGELYLTDGGIETTLIFHEGFELPYFAAFDLLKTANGRAALRRYFCSYAALAREHRANLVLESATWRASPDWGRKLGYSERALAEVNQEAIEMLREIRSEYERENTHMVISGCIGPRGDGYNSSQQLSADQAERYHSFQAGAFAESEADMISAITMAHEGEAIGVARAARAVDMPVVISFTVETDGKLPSGQCLPEAIRSVDSATGAWPAYYMINCAHPTHFDSVLDVHAEWAQRIRGVRANASRQSHAELDEATELDDGDPQQFGSECVALKRKLKSLNVLGGCCGTDHRHIEAICKAYSTRAFC